MEEKCYINEKGEEMKNSANILKDTLIKHSLNNFKPRAINPKISLKVQIGTQIIERIQKELGIFKKEVK